MILWCWTSQIPVKQTMALCKISEKATRHWFDLFRCHLPQEKPILERIIQLDEAYFRNVALVMGKQKGTRKLAYDIIRNRSVQRHHAFYFLARNVKPRSRLYTDGAGIYKSIDKWWPVKHQVDIHKKFEFGKTSEIEGTFGNLRTFIRRMYHHSTNENLDKYVSKFCFRFSSPELFNNPRYYLEKSLSLVPIR